MQLNKVALIVLTLVASGGARASVCDADTAARVRELLQQFREYATHQRAVVELKALAPVDVVPPLVSAIRADVAFQQEAWVRDAAYRLLSEVGVALQAHAEYASDEQIAQLIRGLSEPSPTIRGTCLQAMAHVSASHDGEVVEQVLPFLDADNASTLNLAAQVLGRIGAPAKVAMPELGRLLRAEDKRTRAQLDRAREGVVTTPWSTDVEVEIRENAAYARISISGVGVDLEAYRTLDAKGQWGALRALRAPLLRATGKRVGAPLEMGNEECESVARFLSDAARDVVLTLDARVLSVGLMAWMALSTRVPLEVRRSVSGVLKELSTSEVREIREAVDVRALNVGK